MLEKLLPKQLFFMAGGLGQSSLWNTVQTHDFVIICDIVRQNKVKYHIIMIFKIFTIFIDLMTKNLEYFINIVYTQCHMDVINYKDMF